MKKMLLLLALLAFTTTSLIAEPIISSWFTDLSGRYARIYETTADETAQNAVTTWVRGQGTQALPTYAGVHEIATTTTDLYIRTTNLGYHIMGPWYNNGNLFPNYPANQADIYRIPRNRNTSLTAGKVVKDKTGGNTIGYMVDGVALFDSRDAFSFDSSAGIDEDPGNANDPNINGDDIWNRDAYTNEGNTFDSGFAHQAGANYHYHANPIALRYLLKDSVDYTKTTNTYTESPNGYHSPIIGWFRDGIPLYGPYAYSDPNDPTSAVRRMISGYQRRDGSNGSLDLAASSGSHIQTNLQNSLTGRTILPDWVTRNEAAHSTTTLSINQYGPSVSTDFPIGHYVQDYAYKGDLGVCRTDNPRR